MAESFFGSWHIVLGHVNSHFLQSFTISGSENADDRYHVVSADPLELSVRGEEWKIQLEWFPFAPDAAYQPSTVRRTTKFVVGKGLVVQLDAAARASVLSDSDYNNLTLICTSTDLEINPTPTANPYDFTLPER